jgi:hypothetical protein
VVLWIFSLLFVRVLSVVGHTLSFGSSISKMKENNIKDMVGI